MRKHLLALAFALALFIVVPSPALATHTDPSGECDVTLAAGTYDFDTYLDNPSHYADGDAGSDTQAVYCFAAGVHRDNATYRNGNVTIPDSLSTTTMLRPAPGLTSTPLLRMGWTKIESDNLYAQNLKLDFSNEAGTTWCIPDCGTQITSGEPSPFIQADSVTFYRDDITNDRSSCIHGVLEPTFSQDNGQLEPQYLNVSLSKVHDCGDFRRTEGALGSNSDTCLTPSGNQSGCRSDIHDHDVYMQRGWDWTFTDNYIIKAAARSFSLHDHGHGLEAYRNIIDQSGSSGVHFSYDGSDSNAGGHVIEGNIITDAGNDPNISHFNGGGVMQSQIENNCLQDDNAGDDGDPLNNNIQNDTSNTDTTYTPTTGSTFADTSKFYFNGNVIVQDGGTLYAMDDSSNGGSYGVSSSAPAQCLLDDPLGTPGPVTNVP